MNLTQVAVRRWQVTMVAFLLLVMLGYNAFRQIPRAVDPYFPIPAVAVIVTLPGAVYTSFYNQAINKDAPHPAAARLWQEFLYSAEAQNLFIVGGAYPVTIQTLQEAGTVDADALSVLGELAGELVTPTADQAAAAGTLLAEKWAAAIS